MARAKLSKTDKLREGLSFDIEQQRKFESVRQWVLCVVHTAFSLEKLSKPEKVKPEKVSFT